jgi:hypothetical protein
MSLADWPSPARRSTWRSRSFKRVGFGPRFQRQLRIDRAAAAMHGAQGFGKILGRRIFEQITGDAGIQCATQKTGARKRGDDDRLDRQFVALDALNQFKPGDAGHFDVGHQHIRLQSLHFAPGCLAIGMPNPSTSISDSRLSMPTTHREPSPDLRPTARGSCSTSRRSSVASASTDRSDIRSCSRTFCAKRNANALSFVPLLGRRFNGKRSAQRADAHACR